MAGKLRIHFPGALCHGISRDNQGQYISHDDDDRESHLTILQGLPTRAITVPTLS